MVPSPTAPVAVNVTGLPASPALVAVRVLAPTAGPNVQLPTVAIPLAFVVALKAVAEPPPEATAKVTLTPLTGLLLMSRTSTLGAATQLAINAGNSQTATAGTAVATAPSVLVRDINNNPVSGVSVTFAVAV